MSDTPISERIASALDRVGGTETPAGRARRIAALTLVATIFSVPVALIVGKIVSHILKVDMPADSFVAIHSGVTAMIISAPLIAYCVMLVAAMRKAREDLADAVSKAEAANHAKSAFLANMSHEVRTPLNGVLGMAQALSHSGLDEKQQEQVETIIDSGHALISIVNDVLDISKVEAGKMEISPTPSSLAHCLSKVIRLYEPTARDKSVALEFSTRGCAHDDYLIDTVRVRQCLTNLVSNAIKFTDRGSVTVEARTTQLSDAEDEISIAVTDTGIGMREDALETIFSEFSQADNSTTRRFGGTGLGLSIARKLAQLMDGDVAVKSAPGEGSTFTLTLRARRTASNSDAPGEMAGAAKDETQAARKRVLLVDDNLINRKVANVFLEAVSALVVEAENGAAALAALDQGDFDLVLLDLQMPVMDGEAVIGRIRSSDRPYRHVPVIAMTADAMSGDRERCLQLGMDGYIAKPIDARRLLTEINRVLSTKETARGDIAAA
ncbi:MAG: ATP-binding protein [Parvularculaceae bacterium]